MKLETLVSTMEKSQNEIIQLYNKINIQTDAIIVNQKDSTNSKQNYLINGKKVTIINSLEKGLSKSRNELLYNSNANIGIIADDDLVYLDGYDKIIEKAYKESKDADIICFKVYKGEKPFKKYSDKQEKINFIKSFQKSSVEITYKVNSIIKNNIVFDENFGAGSKKYTAGEENIFLIDCLKKGLKIIYKPIFIAKLDDTRKSNWFKGYDYQYFKTKGAVFYRISKFCCFMLILQFAIRKYRLYKKNLGIYEAVKYMLEGVKEYRYEKKNNLLYG